MASENSGPGLPPKPLSRPLKKPRVPPPVRSVPPETTESSTGEASTTSDGPPPIPPRPQPTPARPSSGKKPLPIPKLRCQSLSVDFQGGYGTASDSEKKLSAVLQRKSSLPHAASSEETTTSLPSRPPEKDVVLSKPFPLPDLGEKHSESFPLQIRVHRGYSGQTDNTTISAGDVYNIHCVKRQKVVQIKDVQGTVYSIPMNSSIKLGLVYEQSGKTEPLVFRKVSDLLSVGTLPKVICATKAFKTADVKSSIQEKEILIVRQVHKPKIRGKKHVEVFSLVSRTEKFLDSDCEGHFSTEPALVGLLIPEMFEFLPAILPCEAFLITDATLESSLRYLSNSIILAPVTLLEAKTEASLIASSVLDPEMVPESTENGESLLHIPLDDCLSNVDVAIVEMEKSEMEKLYDETKNVLDSLDLSKLKSYRDIGSDRLNSVQSLFYTSIKKGDESVGVELNVPTRPCVSAAAEEKEEIVPPQEQSDLENENGIDDEYVEIMSPQRVYAEEDTPTYDVMEPPEQYGETAAKTASAVARRDQETVPALPPRSGSNPISNTQEYEIVGERSHYSYHAMPDETNADIREQLLAEITEIKLALLQLGKRLESLERKIKDLPQSAAAPIALTQGSREAQSKNNRLYLRSLDVSKVQQVLAAMKLEQYQAKFLEEQISGEILADLGEEELEQELGVCIRVHRLRLLKIAAGFHRAEMD